MTGGCVHTDLLPEDLSPRSVAGCDECLRAGDTWVHLRECGVCGQVGCCDNSAGRHATLHNRATGHPVVRSLQPGEPWGWCYQDRLFLAPVELALPGETSGAQR